MYLQDLFEFFEIEFIIIFVLDSLLFLVVIQQGFVFEYVSFKYLNSEYWAIWNLFFQFWLGEKLVLVGENGVGKIILVKLLAWFYEFMEGCILIDGVDIWEYSLLELCNNIGIIFQDYIWFQFKVGENIVIGNIGVLEDSLAIEEVVYKSFVDIVVDIFFEWYD